MSEVKHLAGIEEQLVATPRIRLNVLTSGPDDGIPVIFIHGNFTSALWWEEVMLSLPEGFRAIAFDMRGYGWTEDKPIDATRGLRDISDDLAALMETLEIEEAHLVGWSLGGGVIYRFLIDYPGRALSVTLIGPVSPYGFGGTKDLAGTPCYADFAGSGGGVVNPEFVRRIKEGDRTAEDPNSPRNVINTFYYKPPFRHPREEELLTGALQEKIGTEKYPGDFVASDNWPNVAPGNFGPINAGAPKYAIKDVPELLELVSKPDICWVRGENDQIVADNSMFDFGALGKLGFVPGWPGDDVYPPQPMVGQTRDVLEKYAAKGGSFEEHVIPDTGHGPHMEKLDAFNAIFHPFIKRF